MVKLDSVFFMFPETPFEIFSTHIWNVGGGFVCIVTFKKKKFPSLLIKQFDANISCQMGIFLV